MKIQVYKFIGITPLLMSNIDSVNRDLPGIKLGTKPNKGDIELIAEGHTYKDAAWGSDKYIKATYYMPTQALRSSLLTGCTGQKMAGTRQSPANIFKALIFPAEEKALLTNHTGKPVKSHVVQVDSGVNGTGKSAKRIIVVRPRIDEWETTVPFEVDDEFAPPNFDEFMDLVLALWNRAGRVAGIGAWRPEKQGRFGRYSVEMV